MISLVELRTRGHPMMSGVQTPSQCPDTGQPPERWACNLLRTKHFHGVSSRNQPPYLLKSRYGKVSLLNNHSLTNNAKVVYAKLLSYAWHNNQVFPGQERMAEEIGSSKSTVGRAVQEL